MPTIITSRCVASPVGQFETANKNVLKQHRHQHQKRGTGERPKDRPQSANDDHEQHQKRFLNAKRFADLNRPKIDGKE